MGFTYMPADADLDGCNLHMSILIIEIPNTLTMVIFGIMLNIDSIEEKTNPI
jgi:hypothetical protein